MKKIFFILTDAGTILGRIIKLKTKKEYSHVSIALDDKLERMYSFSRLHPYNAFVGGFTHEKINEGSFKRFKNTIANIYCIEIEDYQYEKLEEIINKFIENKKQYKFSVLGLIAVLFNKKIPRKRHFYCAEFVKYVLEKSGININIPEIPKPEHFENIENSTKTYEGLFNQYKVS